MLHKLKKVIGLSSDSNSIRKLFGIIQFKYKDKIKLIIKTTFKIIGAAAAAANLLLELRMPAKKEDKLTNNKNGNVILVSSTAKLNLV